MPPGAPVGIIFAAYHALGSAYFTLEIQAAENERQEMG
jgi:hypothetical protein